VSKGMVHSVPGGKLLEIPRDQDMGWKAAVTYNFDGGELWIQDRTGELDSDVKLPGWLVSEIFELIMNSKKDRQEYLYAKRDLHQYDRGKPGVLVDPNPKPRARVDGHLWDCTLRNESGQEQTIPTLLLTDKKWEVEEATKDLFPGWTLLSYMYKTKVDNVFTDPGLS